MLPPIGEETFLTCMVLAIAVGALLGFALGYKIKERKYSEELASAIREATKERAPKGPEYAVVRTPDGREHKARLPLRRC